MVSKQREDSAGEFDLRVMRKMARECGWTLRELADRYVETTRSDMQRIQLALDSETLPEVARLSHGLAGASGFTGITGMTEVLQDLEKACRDENPADRVADRFQVVRHRFDEIQGSLARVDTV